MIRLNKIVLNLYFFPLFILVTIGVLLLIPLLRFFNWLAIKKPEATGFRLGIRLYGLVLCKIVSPFISISLKDKSGGLPDTAIFVANHASSVDPYCFGLLKYENAFLTSWPFTIPLFKGAMKKAGYLDARKGWQEISSRGEQLLESGCSLIIWPEGHRSKDGTLGEFRNGAFRIACESETPVVPVCIIGTNTLLPPGRYLLSPATITLVLLPPCFPEHRTTDTDRKTVVSMNKKVRSKIYNELTEQQHLRNDTDTTRSSTQTA